MAVWGMTKIQAGWITTVTLISSAIGGWLAVCWRTGSARAHSSIVHCLVRLLHFSLRVHEFLRTVAGQRLLQGLDSRRVGGRLGADRGNDPPAARGKAVGTMQSGWAVGWGVANLLFLLLYSMLPEQLAWRAMFWSGILPALLVFYIRATCRNRRFYSATGARQRSAAATSWRSFRPDC